MTTKEELEKEAKTYAEEHKMDMIDYHDSLFMEDAYIASAEPRERRIEELEKENAALKEQLGNKQMQSRKETSDFVWKLKTANEQKTEHLTKAKNIIIRLLEALIVIDGEETRELKEVKEAEQFLNSEVEK